MPRPLMLARHRPASLYDGQSCVLLELPRENLDTYSRFSDPVSRAVVSSSLVASKQGSKGHRVHIGEGTEGHFHSTGGLCLTSTAFQKIKLVATYKSHEASHENLKLSLKSCTPTALARISAWHSLLELSGNDPFLQVRAQVCRSPHHSLLPATQHAHSLTLPVRATPDLKAGKSWFEAQLCDKRLSGFWQRLNPSKPQLLLL